MVDPVLTLDNQRASVQPGGQVSLTVTISNPSSIVEGYRLEVLGQEPSKWAEMVPTEVSIYPQQQATATIVFSPPAGNSAPGGVFPFGILARSLVTEDCSAVVEGDVEIAKVYGLQAKIVPVTSTGRWRGRHVIQYSNWGNSPVRLRLQASDPDAALGILLPPDAVNLPVGANATVRVKVRTRHPKLQGTPTRLAFQIVGERVDANATGPAPAYSDPGRPVVDGAFVQKPILTRASIMVASLVLVAGVALGFALTRDHKFEKLDDAPVVTPTGASSGPQTSPVTSPPESSPPPDSSPPPESSPPPDSSPPPESSPPPDSSPPPGSSPPQSSPPQTSSPVDPLPDGSWVAVPSQYTAIVTGGTLADVEKAAADLRARGLPARVFNTSVDADPRLNSNPNAPLNGSYLVAVGPYASEQDAQAACETIGSTPGNPCYAWLISSASPSPQSS